VKLSKKDSRNLSNVIAVDFSTHLDQCVCISLSRGTAAFWYWDLRQSRCKMQSRRMRLLAAA